MIFSFWSKLVEVSEKFKEYMISHDQSVILYTALFMTGLLIFAFIFNALNKDK